MALSLQIVDSVDCLGVYCPIRHTVTGRRFQFNNQADQQHDADKQNNLENCTRGYHHLPAYLGGHPERAIRLCCHNAHQRIYTAVTVTNLK
jgi:hypothetical protein